jgi:hypothetical protein
MTVADIDDAMGWAQGTARRRRWRDPADGGLPPADAELGGVALWFRATISRWRARQEPDPRPDEPDPEHLHPDPEPEPEQLVPVDHAVDPAEPDATDSELADEPDEPATDRADTGATVPDPDDAPEQDEAGPVPDALRSGFQLDPGQDVLAYVHGSWIPAQVRSRDRRTVVVDYQLTPGPLGARRQRVRIDQVRLDPGQG